MKIKSIRSSAMLLLACAALSLALAGCASMDASNQRSLLSAAGFRVLTPTTAKQRELYTNAESYKVLRGDKNGRVFYAYKDEKQGVAYVGGEAEYQRYQQLAVQQNIANQNMLAAQMQRDAAWGWYGAWGPGVWGPGYRGSRVIIHR
jgi:hypothetical protein